MPVISLPRVQFRVRTLLAIVALLAVPFAWLGWQAAIVRDREETLHRIEVSGARIFYGEDAFYIRGGYNFESHREHSESLTPSWLRRMLGDRAVSEIEFPRVVSANDLEMASHVPEAGVHGEIDYT